MDLDPVLTRAIRLIRKKKFWEAIHLLEPKIPLYPRSFRCFYLLGLAHLYSNSFGGALDYFKAAREIKLREPNVLLAFATLYLRRGETDRAVDLYLEVQDVDEKNKLAKKALNIIRKHSRSDTLGDWVESGHLTELYPPLPKAPLSVKPFLVTLAVLAGVAGLGLGGFAVARHTQGLRIPMPFPKNSDRNGLATTVLDQGERRDTVSLGGSYRYILTRAQVLSDYEKARELFGTYNDERAKVLLNRILESNAADSIKNKAEILFSYMDVPGFDTLKDKIPYAEVLKDPALYRGCYVVWAGMATNVVSEQNATNFDFLVGYDTRSRLEGIVPTHFGFSVGVNTEKPLEILGRVQPRDDGTIALEGTAVHQKP